MSRAHIDFGHGGKDPGALGNNLREKDITLAVGLKVGEILENHNVDVSYSRTTDTFIELADRATMANKANADIFVSIHVNSAVNIAARGVETYSHIGSSKGAILAKVIQDSIVQDRIFTSNRGIKTANFAVLRLTTMPAALVELGFISNSQDTILLRNKQLDMAKSIARGILKNLGVKYIDDSNTENGLPILSTTKATIAQMQEWAKKKGANQKLIDLAPIFYDLSNKVGVNPLVTYCQSAKETGYFKFGGVLDITYNNPCGMKNSTGGGDYDANAHKRFKDWQEGIQAQVDHLALYAGAIGYPKANTPDPRHFPYLVGTAKTVEELGGKWAPSASYGTDITKMIKEVENTVVVEETVEKKLDTIKIILHGKELKVDGIFKDKINYIPVRFLEKLGYSVGWKDGKVIIEYKEEE